MHVAVNRVHSILLLRVQFQLLLQLYLEFRSRAFSTNVLSNLNMASVGEEFLFIWKIENFSCLPHQEGDKLTSAEFIVESENKSKWCLWMYPRGDGVGVKGKDHISLFLHNKDLTDLTVFSYIALETTDGDFEVQKLIECKKRTYKLVAHGNDVISFANLCQKKHLYLPQDVLTVKCCILPDNGNDQISNNTKLTIVPDPLPIQCSSITRIQVQRRSVTWPIKEISKLFKNRKETNTYYSKSALTKSPSLKLSFSISDDSDEEFAQIEILRTNSYDDKRIFVKCKITILTANKTYKNSIEDTHLFSLQLEDKWILPSFIRLNNLTDDKNGFIDDTLILRCDFAFSCLGTEYHVEAPQYVPCQLEVNKFSKENQLCGSIRHLYTSGDLCDVTLHVDGKTFPAHKLVLCARSPVFRAMFENDMKEKETNAVDIDDVDSETLERFLKFLHSDIVDEELSTVDVCNLYKAAHKYQVDLLKQKCSILILSTLSVSSVCDVIVLADAYKDHLLMAVVDNFMQYHFSETSNSEEWKDFMVSCHKLSEIVTFKALKSKSFL